MQARTQRWRELLAKAQRELGLLYHPKVTEGYISGINMAKPFAPARGHMRASSWIVCTMRATEGCSPLKTRSFRCSQSHRPMKMARETMHRCKQPVKPEIAEVSQAVKSSSCHGGLAVRRHHVSTSCQTCREKEAARRCCIISGSWSHKGQMVLCGGHYERGDQWSNIYLAGPTKGKS